MHNHLGDPVDKAIEELRRRAKDIGEERWTLEKNKGLE